MTSATTNLDAARFEVLYSMHSGAVRRYLHSTVLIDSYTAEDVLQETFLRAWSTPALLNDDPESCWQWLITVARNILVDLLRRRACRPQEIDCMLLEQMPLRRCDIESAITSLAIHRELPKLTSIQREILRQTYLMERSDHEVAKVLNIPIGTVKSRKHSAVDALRRIMRIMSNSRSTVNSPAAAHTLMLAS